MRRRAFASLFLAAFFGSTFEPGLGAAQAQDAPEFVAISGVPTMIYGQRNKCTKDVAPSYEAFLADIPQMTSKFAEIVPRPHLQGNSVPIAAIR